jgi:hypothetical protein
MLTWKEIGDERPGIQRESVVHVWNQICKAVMEDGEDWHQKPIE